MIRHARSHSRRPSGDILGTPKEDLVPPWWRQKIIDAKRAVQAASGKEK